MIEFFEDKILHGYINSKLLWSVENSRWELHNLFPKQFIAYKLGGNEFPIGLNQWAFVGNNSCTGINLSKNDSVLLVCT